MTATESASGGTTEPATEPGDDFRALFDARFESMRRLAYLLGADDPENIAQEAFVRVHDRWHRLGAPERALAYLRRTVVNLSRSRLRHLRVARRVPAAAAPDIASAETQALARAAHGGLRAALATLPRRQRQVVVLRYWLGLDQSEIAELLGIAVGTVKASTHHAMTNLRKALPDQEAQP